MTAPRNTPNPATTVRPERSSKRVSRKKPLAWLPWALLAGIAALLALILIAINLIDDDGPPGEAGDSLGQLGGGDAAPAPNLAVAPAPTSAEVPSALPTPTDIPSALPTDPPAEGSAGSSDGAAPSDAASPGAGASGGASGAALTVGGQDDLLALTGASLAGRSGQPVSGTAEVQSVVSDEGFWVGSSTDERVYVFLTPAARKANGESNFTVKAGQTVQVEGELATTASSPKSLTGVTGGEGLSQLKNQGAFVQASSVALGS